MTATITLTPATAAFDADERIEVLGRTHFIGIGGAGMSVLAEMIPAPSSQAIPKSSQRPSVVPASCIAAIFSHC